MALQTEPVMKTRFERWMDTCGYAPRTYYSYNMFARKMPPDDQITQEFVDQWVSEHPYTTARAFIKDYVIEFLRKTFIVIPRLRGRAPKRKRPIPTKQEFDLLIEALKKEDERIALLCQIQFESDSRIAEMLNLEVEKMDFRNGRYVIRGIGKGNKEFESFITVDTARWVVKMIRAGKLPNHGRLFEALYYDKVNNLLKRVSAEVLGVTITTHALKRACIRWLKKDLKWDGEKIQRYSKHSKYDTTMRYFDEIKNEEIEDIWKKTVANPSSSPSSQEPQN